MGSGERGRQGPIEVLNENGPLGRGGCRRRSDDHISPLPDPGQAIAHEGPQHALDAVPLDRAADRLGHDETDPRLGEVPFGVGACMDDDHGGTGPGATDRPREVGAIA